MMVAVLVAGIGALLAGLVAIGYGIPIKEFGFGNTLIMAGAVAACAGMLMLGLWAAVQELKIIVRRLAGGLPAESPGGPIAPAALSAALGDQAPEDGGFLFSRDQPAAENAGHLEPAAPSMTPPPWHEEAGSRDRGRGDAPAASVEAAPAAKPKRNLLFSSSSRKERERAEARAAEPSVLEPRPASPGPGSPAAPPPAESGEAPPVTFDDAWPKPDRARPAETPLPRRAARTPSTVTPAAATAADRYPPAAPNEEPPPVTVLKSGVVDGMAYSLYSDGSIEAQMPEGMMRFASIDELRAHLDQRP
jgi:hypothetical protein